METQINPNLTHLTINDLWILGAREWDIELLGEIFSDRDVHAIAGIPLNRGHAVDRMI